MPVKKQRAAAKPARRKTASRGKKSSRRKSSGKGAKPGESLLIDVARTVGTTLGALAARSSQAAERLRIGSKRKRS